MSDGSTPVFLQGPLEFEGNGLDKPFLIDESLRYVVPAGATSQPVYFRGGNSTKDMISVVLFRDGKPMRYFPITAKGATHASSAPSSSMTTCARSTTTTSTWSANALSTAVRCTGWWRHCGSRRRYSPII